MTKTPPLIPDPPADAGPGAGARPGSAGASGAGSERMTVAQAFGETVWLLTQSPRHKHFFLSDLEWMVMPPLYLGFFRIFRNETQPIGLATWGQVSPEIAQRLTSAGVRLAPPDWNSGTEIWLIDLVAPFGGQEAMLADLAAGPLAGKTVRYPVTAADGTTTVKILGE